MNSPLPSLTSYGRQWIDDEDVEKVVGVLRSDRLTQGAVVGEFERDLARKVGAPYAVACSSGTAALHLAALSLGVNSEHFVIVPSVTFIATANTMRLVGAEIIIADVDPLSGLMRVSDVEDAISRALTRYGSEKRLSTIVPVHLNGQCEDMYALSELANQKNCTIIEDACHALGASYRAQDQAAARIGSCHDSNVATFSFHPVKTIAMGEGGAVTTNDKELYQRALMHRNHGISRDPALFRYQDLATNETGSLNPWYYEMHELGLNYRASDIHCALGVSQLKKLQKFVDERNRLVTLYDKKLLSLDKRITPIKKRNGCNPAWHLYPVLVDFSDFGTTRSDVMRRLQIQGIGSQVHYLPLHFQPYYRERYGDIRLPGAEEYYQKVLSLPLFYGLQEAQIDMVIETLLNILVRS